MHELTNVQWFLDFGVDPSVEEFLCFMHFRSHESIVSFDQVNGDTSSEPLDPLFFNLRENCNLVAATMTLFCGCIHLFLMATIFVAPSTASNIGHFRPASSLLSQFDDEISLSRRIESPKHRSLQGGNKTAICNDFEAALNRIVLEQLKKPVETQTLLCGSAARDQLDDASFDLNAFFSNELFGEYAECAKNFFNESVLKSNKTTALATDTDACRKEVADTILAINNSTATSTSLRSRKLIIIISILAFGIFVGIILPLLPVALALTITAFRTEHKTRTDCTTSSQCPRNRCCALNLRRDRVCLPTPAIRNVRERKCS
jgi:hypothetical protein